MATPLTLKVSGMHCSGCEGVIEDAVGALPGVQVEHGYQAIRMEVDKTGWNSRPAKRVSSPGVAGWA